MSREAYLAVRQGVEARPNFRRFLITAVLLAPIRWALWRKLQLAELRFVGDKDQGKDGLPGFLTLWKDADADSLASASQSRIRRAACQSVIASRLMMC